jgi:hypothetical protein
MNELTYRKTAITIITLPDNCSGSAEAMRCIIAAAIIEKKSHVMVLPADLVLYGDLASDPGTVAGADGENGMDIHFSANMNMNNVDGDGMDSQAPDRYRRTVDALGSLADVHRREYRVGIEKGMPLAMSMLLADVGEEDEKGIPLKESAKVSMIHVGLIDGEVTATMLEYWWMDGWILAMLQMQCIHTHDHTHHSQFYYRPHRRKRGESRGKMQTLNTLESPPSRTKIDHPPNASSSNSPSSSWKILKIQGPRPNCGFQKLGFILPLIR